jgi:tRNA-specific 2-thiouridylase
VEAFREHLEHPAGLGVRPPGAHDGAAGGAACGDLIRISLRVDGDRVAAAGFEASGCGAMTAAGSAAVALVEDAHVLDAARVGPHAIAAELGGLSPGKFHAADLAADALHRALGAAARAEAAVAASDRVVVAMSGGVDSAVAALLSGDRAVGVTLELWADPAMDGERSCCSPQAVTGARDLAHGMGLPHVTLDLRERFRAEVVDHFLDGYASGVTPNPCVRCNGHVRFDAMLALADALGAARLATGHYARIVRDEAGPLIRAAVDRSKDQSYALARLDPALLDRLSFPLGGLTKDAVRGLARDAGLPVADKRESQDLCFVAGLGGRAFLRRHGGPRLRGGGEIVDREGRVLGRHDGHHNFTVGQRRGLGLSSAQPLYVLDKDAASGRITVGPHEALATRRVRLEAARLHRGPDAVESVRLRYRSAPIPCRVLRRPSDDRGLDLELERPAMAVAAGQLACLMSGDRVVGEGTIASANASEPTGLEGRP